MQREREREREVTMQVICESVGWRCKVESEVSDEDESGKIWVWIFVGNRGLKNTRIH
jgi:hypothetical protein